MRELHDSISEIPHKMRGKEKSPFDTMTSKSKSKGEMVMADKTATALESYRIIAPLLASGLEPVKRVDSDANHCIFL